MIRLLAGLSALALGFGFLGGLAAPLDSLALLRVPAALCLAVAALALRPWARRAAWALAAAGLGSWAVGFVPQAPGGDLTLYQKNVYFVNQAPEALVADILDSGADVVTLQEMSGGNQAILAGLAGAYPQVHACWYRGWRVMVLSRLPFTSRAPLCSEARGLAAAQVQTAAGPLWVVSLHNPWPWPQHGWSRGAALAEAVAGLPGPKVVGGDFNTVPWAATVRRMARAAGGRVLPPRRGSLWLDPLRTLPLDDITGVWRPDLSPLAVPMPIDHVIAPGGRVLRRGKLGSDHIGLLARIELGGGAE